MNSKGRSEYRQGEHTAGRHSFLKSMRCKPPCPHTTELCVNLDSLIEHSVQLLQSSTLNEDLTGHRARPMHQAMVLSLQALTTLKVTNLMTHNLTEAARGLREDAYSRCRVLRGQGDLSLVWSRCQLQPGRLLPEVIISLSRDSVDPSGPILTRAKESATTI